MEPEITLWQPPPACLTLPDGELHLWRFKLETTGVCIDYLRSFLVAEEITRADRLLDQLKKNQFIAARARLRLILGQYLQVRPTRIQFQYHQNGKPSLSESHPSSLSFNLSHSGDWGVVAVAKKMAVGVDIEKKESSVNFLQLSNSYFDKQEKHSLGQYLPAKKRRGFYRLWTQKEAMLKLSGAGFKLPPEINSKDIWQLRTFPISAEYVCSVAFEKKINLIQKFHCSRMWASQ